MVLLTLHILFSLFSFFSHVRPVPGNRLFVVRIYIHCYYAFQNTRYPLNDVSLDYISSYVFFILSTLPRSMNEHFQRISLQSGFLPSSADLSSALLLSWLHLYTLKTFIHKSRQRNSSTPSQREILSMPPSDRRHVTRRSLSRYRTGCES